MRLAGVLLAACACVGLVALEERARLARVVLESALVAGIVVWGAGRIGSSVGALVRGPSNEADRVVVDLHSSEAA